MEISPQEMAVREDFVKKAASLFQRGYATGAAGNMSCLTPDGNLIATPTGSSLGNLDPLNLSKTDLEGNLSMGPKPTKEVKFHLALIKGRNDVKAVVHLHSTYCTALGCLKNLDPHNVIAPFTPYVVMRMGKVGLAPYYKPGSEMLCKAVAEMAPNHKAIILANHGPVVGGIDLNSAINNIEELEATAKLYFILHNNPKEIRYLTDSEVEELL